MFRPLLPSMSIAQEHIANFLEKLISGKKEMKLQSSMELK